MPTEEQINELWEWCGFRLYNPQGKIAEMPNDWARFPIDAPFDIEGTRTTCGHLPPIDLNNLFKYAVPKLEFVEVIIFCDGNRENDKKGIGYYAQLRDEADNIKGHSLEWYEDPALALFWAIYKIIHKEED